MIAKFDGEHRFLSNFWPVRVMLDGVEYPSVEHAYQAAKTLDEKERSFVRLAPSAGSAKWAGRKLKMRPDWEAVKVDVMRGLLQQKFARGTELGAALAETGDEELIEGNTWGDRFWGVCKGEGLNMLGLLLMEVRAQLTHER